jgi:dienelactone hydrolase
MLLIPNAGPCLLGAESPESAARTWGCALASSGLTVAIPRLPGYARFSSTQNKRRLLEGACVLGEIIAEAARVLDTLLEQPGVAGSRVWVGGRGVGGLAALMLGWLDSRVGGVLADAPVRWGTAVELEALIVPRSHPLTDLPELAALIAPRPLVLVEPAEQPHPFDPPPANVQDMALAAASAYALLDVPQNLILFSADRAQETIKWIHAKSNLVIEAKEPKRWVIPGPRPRRRFAVTNYTDSDAWKRAAGCLRREYRRVAGLPQVNVPLCVDQVGEKRLEDCTRHEYHIRTGTYCYANLTFLRPDGPVRPRTTILCLPGSSSDVVRVENQYGHEVVAQGWNAAIIDARVALYPFHPGIAEERAMVNQSLHDLLCVLDYVAQREDVDPERIGAMGVSQGGTHSWMLAAMDERVAAAAPICGVCTYRGLPAENRARGHDACIQTYLDSHSIYYYTPGVLHIAEQQDLCALIAPRPFALIGANRDNCFPLQGMRECARDLTHVYRLLGAEENFRYVEFEGPHSMPLHSRKTAYAFFREHLDT